MKQFLLFTCILISAASFSQSTITRTEATFIGGDASWRGFIEQNIDRLVPAKNKAPKGYYNVEVEFYVDTTGKLTSFKALTRYGYGMESEVIRLFKKSPKWVPAREDGKAVRTYKRQAVAFVVQ